MLLVDSSDVRKSALLSLIKKAREEQPDVWNEYFNAMLLILLETVADDDVRTPNYRDVGGAQGLSDTKTWLLLNRFFFFCMEHKTLKIIFNDSFFLVFKVNCWPFSFSIIKHI